MTSYQIKLEVTRLPHSSWETQNLLDRVVLNGKEVKSEEFPIHIQSQSKDWKYLTLRTEAKGTLKNFTIANATALLLNQPSYHKSVDQDTWLHEQHQAMAAEADYTADKLRKFKNVTAECVREAKFIIVKIRFATADEAEYIDDSLIMNNVAQRYMIEGPKGSILAPENVSDYVTRTGKTNSFTGALEEAKVAHSRLNNNFDLEEAHDLSELFSNSQPAVMPSISARRLFLTGEKALIDRKFDDGTPLNGKKWRERDTLPSWHRLDRWQQEAIKRTDEYPISIIEGPPGTGKTRTIAAFLACRTTISENERVLICAPRKWQFESWWMMF